MSTALAIITKGPIAPRGSVPACPPLDADQSADLAVAMVGDILDNTVGEDRQQLLIYDGDPEPLPAIVGEGVELVAQRGSGFADRLANGQADMFAAGFDRVVLMSGDSPTVEPKLVDMAIRRLDDVDVVLGPARDGGYTLLAARQPTPALFQHVDMSTPQVLTQTVARAREADLRIRLVAPRHDIDMVADYENALARGELHHAPRTVATMQRFPTGKGALPGSV